MANMGPLPKPDGERQRTNAPTIPTTNLPAGGFQGPIPECPVELGAAGRRWWLWAWRTPQAAAWSPGDLYVVGRRALLEDEVAKGGDVRGVSQAAVQLEDRLGLSAKAMAQLRWRIVEDEVVVPAGEPVKRRTLKAV
jgi:hypothetical protein